MPGPPVLSGNVAPRAPESMRTRSPPLAFRPGGRAAASPPRPSPAAPANSAPLFSFKSGTVSPSTHGARNTGAENEYFQLLQTPKDRQARLVSAKILTDIVAGKQDVLHGGAKAFKPEKIRNHDFKCHCKWNRPVCRAAQGASIATSSSRM